MQEEILVCLDGSEHSEAILPLARGIAVPMGTKLSLLRILMDPDELPAETEQLTEQARLFGARVKVVIAPEAATAILQELQKNPGAIAAMTSHGRTAWMEAVIGSVAMRVLRGAGRPVILYRPTASSSDSPRTISSIIAALDGSEFSEKIIPFAVEFAKSIGRCHPGRGDSFGF